jgi:diguanylate cyclase (GGDEF)-like protein
MSPDDERPARPRSEDHHANWVLGPLATLAALGVTESMVRMGIPVPNPGPVYMTAVVYSAFRGGYTAALVSTAMALLYAAYFFSMPGALFHYSRENAMALLTLAITTPTLVSMVIVLRRHIAMRSAELVAANRELERLAVTDPLTQLCNRRHIMEELETELRRARRSESPVSVLMLDLDGFKGYNDAFGHPAGDYVLKTAAKVLTSQARNTDVVGRYGGDEFLLVLPDTDAEGALGLAERIRAALEGTPWPRRGLTASIGVATLHETWPNPRASLRGGLLVAEADRALYKSKQAGRNRVTHVGEMREVRRGGS